MEPGTCNTDLSVEKIKEECGGERMIQRLNEESGCQETLLVDNCVKFRLTTLSRWNMIVQLY